MRDETSERLNTLERKLDELLRRVERLELRFAPSAAPRAAKELFWARMAATVELSDEDFEALAAAV